MGSISNGILITSAWEQAAVDRLNAWCRAEDPDRGQVFMPVDMGAAGGTKYVTATVHAMGGNYFRMEAITGGVLRSFNWAFPEGVVLIVGSGNHEALSVVRP